MKILLVAPSHDIFTQELAYNLNKYYPNYFEFSLLDLYNGIWIDKVKQDSFKNLSRKKINIRFLKMFFFFYKLYYFSYYLKKNKLKFDCVHLLYVDPRYFFIFNRLKKISPKLVVSFYGSDFNMKWLSWMQKPILHYSSAISFANPILAEQFDIFYSKIFSPKLKICGFGLTSIEIIKSILTQFTIDKIKSQINLPTDKLIVAIGSNSKSFFQHVEIIHQLTKLPAEMREKLFLILPMTYGGNSQQIKRVRETLKKTDFPHLVMEDFLPLNDVAFYRIATDIMIHLPTHDQLSGTMLEVLMAQNIVITGDWLPYQVLIKNNISFISISSMEKLVNKITEVIPNIELVKEKTTNNTITLWNLYCWEKTIPHWLELYK